MEKIQFDTFIRENALSLDSSKDLVVNGNDYVLTATGGPNTIKGERNLRFDGKSLGINTDTTLRTSALEVYSDTSLDNLLLIKSNSTNAGIKVSTNGLFQFLEFNSLPSAVEGAIAYSGSFFWLGCP